MHGFLSVGWSWIRVPQSGLSTLCRLLVTLRTEVWPTRKAFPESKSLESTTPVEISPTRNRSLQRSAAYSRNMSAHLYDAVRSGFAFSYALPVRRGYKDEHGTVELKYPICFSAGIPTGDSL